MLSLFGDGRNSNSKLVPNPEADCERHTRRRCERTPEAWTSREGERTPDASSVQSVVRKLRCTGLLDVLRLGGAWLVREGLRDGDAGIPSLDRTGDALARSAAALEAWRALFASARSWRPGECCTHSMTATASRESLISSHKQYRESRTMMLAPQDGVRQSTLTSAHRPSEDSKRLHHCGQRRRCLVPQALVVVYLIL